MKGGGGGDERLGFVFTILEIKVERFAGEKGR